MVDLHIDQKDEIDVVPLMCCGIAHKHEVRVALLPDCFRVLRARN